MPDTLVGHVERALVTGFQRHELFALILAETVAGSSVLTWGSPLWNETKRSFFSIWSVIMVLLFAWPTWLAARSAAIGGDADAARAVRLALATAIVLSIATILLLARQKAAGRGRGRGDRAVGRDARGDGSDRAAIVRDFCSSAAGAAFLGGVQRAAPGALVSTDRKLRTPIKGARRCRPSPPSWRASRSRREVLGVGVLASVQPLLTSGGSRRTRPMTTAT